MMRMKEESERASLRLSIKGTKIMASGPITVWQIEGEKVDTMTGFLFLGSKITAQAGMKIARRNINNLRYADDTILVAKNEEEIESLSVRKKEESEKASLKVNIKKKRKKKLR